jgi:hypothetical protein
MEEDVKLMQTPKDLINMFLKKSKTVRVTIFEFYEDRTIVVKVKLRFWNKLWATLNSDYANTLKNSYQSEADEFAPVGLKIEVIFIVCD